MYRNISPVADYWIVIRSTNKAIVSHRKGLDLLMFPFNGEVFDDRLLAQKACDRFNQHQQQSGTVLPIQGLALA